MSRQIEEHIANICRQAGYGSMVEVMRFVTERGEVTEAALLALTEDDITMFYEVYVGPAVDRIEDEILKEAEG